MKVIDMHCDTLYELDKHKGYSLLNAPLQLNLQKMKQADYMLQNFAIFTDLAHDTSNHVNDLITCFNQSMQQYPNYIKQVKSFEDIEEGINNHQMMAMLTIEEGDIVEEDLLKLDELYKQGVRMITLTWNYKNRIGHPNVNYIYQHKGLTEFGKAYVKKCEALGIIIDVSHASDQTFYDVLELTSKPFVASHSNARSITNHPRNLTDEMIIALAKRGGVMGINYYKYFVSDDASSTIKNIIKHIDYIKSIAGIDVIGLGSDFDGIDDDLELDSVDKLPLLEEALLNHGYTYEEVEKIFYKNVLRVYREVL